MWKKRVLNAIESYLFLLPAGIILIIFLYYPLVNSIEFSFYRFENFLPSEFVGLENFRTAFNDPMFWNSIYLTFKWVLMNAFLPTLGGLILALLLEYFTRRLWFTNTVRTILFMPQMMSMVAVGLLWTLIYDPNLGIINAVLKFFGYTGKFVALGNLDTAIYMVYIPVLWKGVGFSMVVFSAAMQSINHEILESAIVEGATKWKQIRYITVPSIMSTITMVIIINMIDGFKAFDLLYVLTRGGPGNSTEITAVYAYKQAFFAYKFEYASTMLFCLLICVIVFLIVFQTVFGKLERHYSAD